MSYTEKLCTIEDLETLIKVSKEKYNELKIEVNMKENELKYKLEIRDTLHQLNEEMKINEKRADQLIKVAKYNAELAQENYDMKQEKILEKDKQTKILQKQLKEAYEESMRIFERNPLVIKRNQLRKENAKRKFDILFLKQKLSDAEEIHANLKKMEILVEQKRIVKFAEKMVNYYKKQKERNEMIVNEQNLENFNKIQEQKKYLQVTKKSQENFVETQKKLELSSFIVPKNYDFLYKKTSSQFQKNIESPNLNISQIQLPTLNMANYQFDPKKYLTRNFSSIISKPSEQQNYTSPLNFKSSILPKFEYNKQKCTTTPKMEKKSKSQTKQKQELKRQSEPPQSIIKPKVSTITKKYQDVKLPLNTSVDMEERMFLSQPESKNSSQFEDTVISLSQDSKKSVTSNKGTPKATNVDNISMSQSRQSLKPNQPFNQPQSKKQSTNQMFNLQSSFSKNTDSNDVQKQNQPDYRRQTSTMGQMFNVQSVLPKRTGTNEIQTSSVNQMFNMQVTVPKNTETNEGQKQNPPEYNRQTPAKGQNQIEQNNQTPLINQMSKTVNFSKPVSQSLETKSPYFVNQTITSQEESVISLSSAEQSDQMNVSSNQQPSQISATDTSGEYIDTTNQPMDIEQIMNAEGIPMMDFNNAGYNIMQYYGENPNDMAMMPGLEENQYLSPPNFVSPEGSVSGNNQEVNTPTPAVTNLFGASENTGNSFFSFGQPQPKSGGIFNMF